MSSHTLKPIGYFHSHQSEKYMAPKQASFGKEGGQIILESGCDYEIALSDLVGFDRIWIIFLFDRNTSWKPKVMTPRSTVKKGVFATRSPHRPNPIGLSCVELVEVKGRVVSVGKNDLLDGTPILDIKPYLPYADAFPKSRTGWVEEGNPCYMVKWKRRAKMQALFVEEYAALPLINSVEMRLSDNPFPFPNHRIKKLEEDRYELAVKTWRVRYTVKEFVVTVEEIGSGYDEETLLGLKPSRWGDVEIHSVFKSRYAETQGRGDAEEN